MAGPLTLIIPAKGVCPDVHLNIGRVVTRPDNVSPGLAACAGSPSRLPARMCPQVPASTAEEVVAALGDGIDVLIDSARPLVAAIDNRGRHGNRSDSHRAGGDSGERVRISR